MRGKQLSLVVVSLLIGLGVAVALAELMLRVVGVQSQFVYTPNPYFGWWNTAGHEYVKTTEDQTVDVVINSHGLRDREYPYEKPPGTKRVLVLGDSFAEAVQVPLEATFAKVLETRLNERDGQRVEVINSGVAGFGTDNSLLFYKHEGAKYDADVVLLLFYIGNDVRNNWYPLDEQDSGGPRKPVYDLGADGLVLQRYPFAAHESLLTHTKVFLSRHSMLYSFARNLREQLRARSTPSAAAGGEVPVPLDLHLFQAQLPAAWEKAWQLTRALLGELREETTRQGAQLVVVTVPAAFQIQPELWEKIFTDNPSLRRLDWTLDAPNARLAQILHDERIPGLDLLAALRAQGGALYFPIDNHWNEAGHEAGARQAVELLAPLLTEDAPPSATGR
jgi:hypothetical protein